MSVSSRGARSVQKTGGLTSSKTTAVAARGGRTGNGVDAFGISTVGWSTLEAKFNELVELMESPASGVNAMQARTQHREEMHGIISALLDRAQEECRTLLLDGNAAAAEEAGVLVLKLRERFTGSNSLELVPVYLHLARTKQFVERYGEAEDMLSLASYIIQRHQRDERLTVATKAELHQTYGLLYAADEKLEVAVKHLTCACYYMSCLHGPQHVLTTFSYFDLGNVFAAKAMIENAMAMYDNTKEIWHTHLTAVLEEILAARDEKEKMKRYAEEAGEQADDGYPSAIAFGTENLVDASKMLHGIFGIQKERYRVNHPSTARAEFVLGLFLLWIKDEREAAGHLAAAHASSQAFYGPRHPVVEEIESWSAKFGVPLENACCGVEGGLSTANTERTNNNSESGQALSQH